MRPEDLEQFAVADGLLGQIITSGATGLSDDERVMLLERARQNLASAFDSSLEDAGRAMHEAARHGDVEVRAGNEFACVACWGRLLVVMTRAELRGICHPELN